MSKQPDGPAIDPSGMANNQSAMFGVHTYNVKSDQATTEGAVTLPDPGMGIDTSTNAAFVRDAPNLAFRLPFHLEHLFGCHDADKGP